MQSIDMNQTSRSGTPEQAGAHTQPAQSASAANPSAPMENLAVSDMATTAAAPLTTLQVSMGGFTRSIPLTTLTFPDHITNTFTLWSGSHPATTIDAATNSFRVDLNLLASAAAALPAEVLTEHLDALVALVGTLQQNKTDGLTVANLWRLAGIDKDALGLARSCINMMQTWMGVFVGRLKKPGTWLDGPGGMEEEDGEVVVGDEDWERALNACFVFGWEGCWRAIAARLAYLCSWSGKRLETEVCGAGTAEAILATCNRVLEHFFEGADSALRKWTARLAAHPCTNMVCNTHRLGALNGFLVACGLAPRRQVTKALAEMILALELMAADNHEAAADLRNTYGGWCAFCCEPTDTSMLFPLEDLLCDLTWELQAQLVEYTVYPRE
ncbi:uncharacterized protein B0T15DRAFT_501856 [Chaetomium strumarium]|uniref:Uncharacterized protein n=1 Tax=Chaetomium strumarium TaxID=1170767 RepID=A0AAJ0GWX1_9PEZI|nr:hypothetical protein B0T15DRAFT_501856 [Chaetomium strumarium]